MTDNVKNQVFCGDCIDVMRRELGDGCVDLVVFSPPYDDAREYGGGWSLDLHGTGQQLFRVVKDGGICAVVIGQMRRNRRENLTAYRMILDWVDTIGWGLFQTIIYNRDGVPGGWWNPSFRVDHEYILLFVKGDAPAHFDKEPLKVPAKHGGKNLKSGGFRQADGGFDETQRGFVVPNMKCRGTVWPYLASSTEGNRIKTRHPATFPDKLAEDLILCFSKPGEVVLDPFAGSGTTLVMAEKSRRAYIGIDASQDYCEIATTRLDVELRQERLL